MKHKGFTIKMQSKKSWFVFNEEGNRLGFPTFVEFPEGMPIVFEFIRSKDAQKAINDYLNARTPEEQ